MVAPSAPAASPAPTHARGSSASTIRQRRPAFEFEATTPRYWYANDPFLSLYWTMLSSLFPEGERFFVRSVRRYLERIADPALRRDVSGFIAQEAMHTKEHASINAAMSRLGVDAERIDRELRPILRGIERIITPRMALAATCALEHFTATIAEQLLREPEHREQGDPAVMGLWLWHALEESEHKAVAFDVYRHVGGHYPERVVVMVAATIIFLALTGYWHVRLVAREGKLFEIRKNLRGLAYLYGRRGLFARILPQYLAYYRPSFHPNDEDASALLSTWRERLFGEGGMLRERPRKGSIAEEAARSDRTERTSDE